MNTLSYAAFEANLAGTFDRVNADHVPILITRPNGKPAVIVSLEDFKSYEETAYLMASPKNLQRLNQAIAEIEAGNFQHSSKNDTIRLALERLFTTTNKSLSPYELGKEGFGSDQTHEGDIAQNTKALLKARFTPNADC